MAVSVVANFVFSNRMLGESFTHVDAIGCAVTTQGVIIGAIYGPHIPEDEQVPPPRANTTGCDAATSQVSAMIDRYFEQPGFYAFFVGLFAVIFALYAINRRGKRLILAMQPSNSGDGGNSETGPLVDGLFAMYRAARQSRSRCKAAVEELLLTVYSLGHTLSNGSGRSCIVWIVATAAKPLAGRDLVEGQPQTNDQQLLPSCIQNLIV